MASGTADLLPTLSTTVPLLAGESFLTDKLIAGQYSSVTILVFSDRDTNVSVEFSGDGINFDLAILKSFNANIGASESTPILSKWMRVLVENTDVTFDQTVLRVHTYANIQNTSIAATLEIVNNLPPSVLVDNLPLSGNVLLVGNPVTIFSSDFNHSEIVDPMNNVVVSAGQHFDCNGSSWRSLNLNALLVSSLAFISQITGGRRFEAKAGASVGSYGAMISSRFTSPGNGGKIYLTAGALIRAEDLLDGNRQRALVGCVTGPGRLGRDNALGDDGVAAFGMWENSFVGKIEELEIVFCGGHLGEFIVSIHQPNWNMDKADGTKNLPEMDATTTFKAFRIIIDHVGAGRVLYQMQHPISGEWFTVHFIDGISPQESLFRVKSFGALLWFDFFFPATPQKGININFLELQQTANGGPNIPMRVDTFPLQISIALGIHSIAFRCKDLTEMFQGALNRSSAYLGRVSLASKFLGPANQLPIDMMTLSIFQVELSQFAAPSWVDFSRTTPVQVDIAPSFGGGVPTARCILHAAGADGDRTSGSTIVFDNMKELGQGTSVNIEDFLLAPGSVILIELAAMEDYRVTLILDFVTRP